MATESPNKITTLQEFEALTRKGRVLARIETQAEVQLAACTILVPGPLQIGSMYQTQWGPREVIANIPAHWVDITPDAPAHC